jgi:signal transduction histidine kinase
MLRCNVSNDAERQALEHDQGPLEFGRGPKRGSVVRCIVQDPYVSKDHVRIEEQPGGKVRIDNLSSKQPIWLSPNHNIPPGGGASLDLPARLSVGDTVIEVELSGGDSARRELMGTVAAPVRAGQSKGDSLPSLGASPPPEMLTRWFEMLLAVHQAAPGTPDFYQQTAQALVDLVGLDLGMVLLRSGDAWRVMARAWSDESAPGRECSYTILRSVVEERRTFFQSSVRSNSAESLRGVQAVVASPVFDHEDRVVGAVYGSRTEGPRGRAISTLEAQVVQLLATAVTTGLVRQHQEQEAARLRLAAAAAEQAEEAKGHFLAAMSNELRAPLHAIVGYAEVLVEQAGTQGHAAYLPGLHKVLGASRNLLGLLSDIADLSRIKAGKLALATERFAVADMVGEVVASAKPLADKYGTTVQIECPESPGAITGDATRIRQALLNVVSHSCKAAGGPGVSLAVRRLRHEGHDWIQLTVRDQGPGLTAEQLHHLWDEFALADGAVAAAGASLALPLARGLCRAAGGDLFAVSEQGKGCTFTMQLPTEPAPGSKR